MKMSTAKVAITLDENMLRQLDRLVKNRVFENRSRAIQEAVREKLSRLERDRLARECAKLDRKFEQAMADEGLSVEVEEWPEY
jgi:metal-responsive CopG/Arc/MetJ family transcriptional regulator